MPQKRYSIIEKMRTVWSLRELSVNEASAKHGIPESTIRNWQKNYERIKGDYYKYLHDEGIHKVLVAQKLIADKIYNVVDAMDSKKIEAAPLNQLASAIGILVDRFLRIHDAKEIIEESTDNNRYTIEYYDATTGKTSRTPSWAEEDLEDGTSLHDSYLWQTLWENRIGEAADNRNGSRGQEDLVARTHLSDGESSLARLEDDDDTRDWHPD